MVETPGDYSWSSYRSNALGNEDSILSAHAEYLALGRSVGISRRGRKKKTAEEDSMVSRNVGNQLPHKGVEGR